MLNSVLLEGTVLELIGEQPEKPSAIQVCSRRVTKDGVVEVRVPIELGQLRTHPEGQLSLGRHIRAVGSLANSQTGELHLTAEHIEIRMDKPLNR